MLDYLDIVSLSRLFLFMQTAIMIIYIVAYRIMLRSYFRTLALSLGLSVVGFMVLAFNTHYDFVMVVLLGNLFVMSGYILLEVGLLQMINESIPGKKVGLLLVLSMALFVYYLMVVPSVEARIVVLSVTQIIVSIYMLATYSRKLRSEGNRFYIELMLLNLGFVIISLIRITENNHFDVLSIFHTDNNAFKVLILYNLFYAITRTIIIFLYSGPIVEDEFQ